jgi:16S rRNA (cytidine1402-2'-O)-methyltransferase
MTKGTIYLIPVTLGDADFRRTIPEHALEITRRLRIFTVEELRSARRYLRLIDKQFPIDDTIFFELNEHSKAEDVSEFLKPVLDGNDMGIMSEAGLPGIADPGSILVNAAHNKNIRVVPLSGPSSILLSLTASGMNGQNFRFLGYLPVKPDQRNNRLREIEEAVMTGETQIFIETPYRAQKMFESIITVCHRETRLCVASDITLPTEMIRTLNVSEWKKENIELNDHLVVFLLGK